MAYLDGIDEEYLLNVGDVLILGHGEYRRVEVVTYKGIEGYVMFAINERVIGCMERYLCARRVNDGYPKIIRKGTEAYTEFLATLGENK